MRLLVGAVFVWSGVTKLQDPQFFGFGLKAFRLGIPDHLLILLAFVIPWTEMVSGVLLVAGAWSRAAATVIVILMAFFDAGILSLIVRDLSVSCPCFGTFQLVCQGPLGACHLARNLLFAAGAAYVLLDGPGAFAIEREKQSATGADRHSA